MDAGQGSSGEAAPGADGTAVPEINIEPGSPPRDDDPAYDSIREAEAVSQYENLQLASVGRAAANRSSTKNSTRRKSTIRQSRSGSAGRSRGRSKTSSDRKGKGSSFAPQEGVKRYFRENAPVQEILEALLIPDDGEDIDGILRCLLALEHCLETDPKNAQIVGDNPDGLSIIITMVGRYDTMDNIVATSLWSLSNVAVSESLAQIVSSAGGDTCALEVLARTRPPEVVLHASIALLCNLALHESLREGLVHKLALTRTHRALDTYQQHEWIQYTAIQTLQNFANTASLCEKMMEENTIQRVVTAMKYFSDHEDLLQSSNWILSCLLFSVNDDQRQAIQREHNIASVIMLSMKDSPDHIGVHFTGLSALSNLGRNESLVDDLALAGIVEVCAGVLERHTSHEGVQMVAGRCLVVCASSAHAKRDYNRYKVRALCEAVRERLPDSNASAEAAEAMRLYKGGSCCAIL
ncbi:uncharacterized protein LOC135808703 [Sycon ciliatum]|uniref:uncharacterized protein LOC135808703 n=1 Tax=Sycon ciliatum TaxID=27933 RepID=UPI0031F6C811